VALPRGAESGWRITVPNEIRQIRPNFELVESVMFPADPHVVASAGSGKTLGWNPLTVIDMNHKGLPAVCPLGKLVGATTGRVSIGGEARSFGEPSFVAGTQPLVGLPSVAWDSKSPLDMP